MKFFTNRNFNKMMGRLDEAERAAQKHVKGDSFVDPLTSRGSAEDRTVRLRGTTRVNANLDNLSKYISNGFVQNIIEMPAEDATGEWITIEATLDGEQNDEIAEMIDNRMKDLNIQSKLEDLIRYSRLNANGAFFYYAVKANQIQEGPILAQPIPEQIKSIQFINVIDDSDKVTIVNKNTSDATKEDYNQMKFSIHSQEIHPSRLSWLVNSWIPSQTTGISIVQTINDAIVAQDSGLWSSATLLQSMALNIFKSDEIADLSPTQKAELLAKIKHLMITYSAIALKSEEGFEQLSLQMTGMKELFEFIFNNLSGLSKIPQKILLGQAHGIIGAGEWDSLNYFSRISRFQENKLRDIIQKIVNMVVREENGEIYQALNGNFEGFDAAFTFNNLWKLDPVAEADTELKSSQRDQIDITMGKTSPEEARSLDPRYAHLEPFEMDRTMPPNMTPPISSGPEEKPDVPDENKTDGEE